MENILVDFYKRLFTNDVLDMQIQTEIIDDLELMQSGSYARVFLQKMKFCLRFTTNTKHS